ncbi:MAG: hypothetical protein AAGE65_14595 [Planctomycetota bacterium]
MGAGTAAASEPSLSDARRAVEAAVAEERQPAWVAALGDTLGTWIELQSADPASIGDLLRRFHANRSWEPEKATAEARALTEQMRRDATRWLSMAAAPGSPRSWPAMPDVDWTAMRLVDGRFRVDGRPVFPLGFSWFDEVEFADYHVGGEPEPFAETLVPVIEELKALGVGMHEVNVRVASLLREDPEQSRYAAEWLKQRFDLYAEHGVTGNINFIWNHTQPLERQAPGVTKSVWHFFRLDIDHPAFDRLSKQAMDTLFGTLGPHPALASVSLANEPEFPVEGWTQHTLARLAQERPELVFEFDGEPGAYVQAAPAELKPKLYDWNRQRGTRAMRHLAEAIRKHTPDVPIHVKIQDLSSVGTNPHNAGNGIDRARLAEFTDLAGIDTRLLPVTDPRAAAESWDPDRYAVQWVHGMLAYDHLLTLAPDQPIFDSEVHAFSTSAIRVPGIDPAHARASMWLMALHGSTGNIVWYWQRRDHPEIRHPALSHAFDGSLTTQPALVGELFRAHAELNAFGPQVEALATADRPIGVEFSSAATLADPTHLHAVHAAYEAAAQLGVAVTVGEVGDAEPALWVRTLDADDADEPPVGPDDDAKTWHAKLAKRLADTGNTPAVRLLDQRDAPAFGTVYRTVRDPEAPQQWLTGLVHLGATRSERQAVDAHGNRLRGVDLLTGETIDGDGFTLEPRGVRLIRWDTP